jgi:hypothetical protein
MAEAQRFKSMKGTVTLEGLEGSMTFGIAGSRVPNELKDLPAYVAECVKHSFLGASDVEVDALKKRVADLEKQLEKKIGELKEAKDARK